jgi:hypothetical protein
MGDELTLTASELRGIMATQFPFAYGAVFDGDYNVPSIGGVDVFRKELGALLLDYYGDKWETFFDCDNFGLEAITLACRKHWIARKEGGGNAQGIAWGILGFKLIPEDPTSGHLVSVWVDAEKKVHVFEPQNRKDLVLTENQCASAFFYLFS